MCLKGLKCGVVFGTYLHCYIDSYILPQRVIAEKIFD